MSECKNQTNDDKWRNILHFATIKFIRRHKAASVTLFQIIDWIKIIKKFPWSVQLYLDCELRVETENAENFSGDKLKKILQNIECVFFVSRDI